jgi:adenine-specific DNA-methyltransferase
MPTLDWLNRASAFTTAAKVPYRLLEQVSVHTSSPENTTNSIAAQAINTPATAINASKNGLNTDNLLIQGDNLEALKALLPFYRGQVKCIFIDPPYNTKSAFEHYDDNLEHAQWLSMMLPRLQLLRELLREDGSIWVTIDDNEGHYLKVLMDEVFGRGNFVANVVWQKRVSPANDATHFSSDHDNIIVFAKQKGSWALNRLERTELQNSYYKNPDNDHRGDWNSVTYTGNKTRLERPNLYYGIRNPNTNEMVFPPETLTWRYGEETHLKNEKENLLYWGKNGDSKAPRMKMFLESASAVVPRSVWSAADAGSTQLSMTEQKILFANAFGTPKPELLLQRILNIATNEGDLVLDSFLGSGTTAAVAHKMGRRWIGIEMGEHAATHCLPRLQKVLDGEQGGISKAVNWVGGGGFRFMRLGEPVFDDRGRINPAVRFATLAAFVWQQDTGTALDLAASKPGTPHIGTHYIFNSALGNKYAVYSQIEPLKQGETADLAFQAPPELPEPAPEVPQTPKGTAYYLLYNGILGDKRPASGNVLTRDVLAALLELHAQVLADAPEGAELDLIVYGEACRLGEERLKQAKVTFRHIPYDVRAR